MNLVQKANVYGHTNSIYESRQTNENGATEQSNLLALKLVQPQQGPVPI